MCLAEQRRTGEKRRDEQQDSDAPMVAGEVTKKRAGRDAEDESADQPRGNRGGGRALCQTDRESGRIAAHERNEEAAKVDEGDRVDIAGNRRKADRPRLIAAWVPDHRRVRPTDACSFDLGSIDDISSSARRFHWHRVADPVRAG